MPCSSTSESLEDDPDSGDHQSLPKKQKISHKDTKPEHHFDIDIKVEQCDIVSESDEDCLRIDEGCDTHDGVIKCGSSETSDNNEFDNDKEVHDDDDLKLINEHNYDEVHKSKPNDYSTKDNDENDSNKIADKDLTAVTNDYSLQYCLESVLMSEDRLKQEIEIYSQKTTSAVDKHVGVLAKNCSKLTKVHKFDTYDLKIAGVLHAFKLWAAQSKARENILMYKCYICNMAWWHLNPFQDHIRTHKEVSMSIESSNAELIIIAHGGTRRFKSITPKGDCWQCQKSIEHFSCGPSKSHLTKPYCCQQCKERFRSCTLLNAHEGKCQRYLKEFFRNNICEPSRQCNYCDTILLSEESYTKHMVLRHSVRSDVYVGSDKPKYHEKCKQVYNNLYFHSCPAADWNYTCDFCEHRFATSRLAMLHRDLSSPTNCMYCRKSLKRSCLLLDHLLKHTSNYIWLYECRRCPSQLFTEEAYIRDHRCHNGYPLNAEHRKMVAPVYCLTPEFAEKLKEEQKEEGEVSRLYLSDVKDNEIEIKSDHKSSDNEADDTDKEFEEMEQSIASAISNFKTVVDNNDNENNANENNCNDIKVNEIDNLTTQIEISIDAEVKVKAEVVSDDEVIEIDDDLEFKKETEDLELELSKVFKASKNITGEIVDASSIHEEINIKQELKEDDDSSSYEDDIIQYSFKPKLEETSVDTNLPSTSICDTSLIGSTKRSLANNSTDFVEVKINNSSVIFKPDQVVQMKEEFDSNDDLSSTSIKSEYDETDILSEEEWDCVKPKKKHFPRKILFKNKIYKCNHCQFAGIHREYKTHLRDHCELRKKKNRVPKEKKYVSDAFKMYQCSRCLIECMSLNSYLLHMKMHGLPEKTCLKCGLRFPTEYLTIEHIEQHIKSNFVRISMIRSHEVVTSRNDFIYQCQQCQATVPNRHFFKHWEMHLEFNKVVKIETETRNVDTSVPKINEDLPTSLDKDLLQKVISALQMRKQMRKRQDGILADRLCVVCDKHFDRIHDIKVHLVQHLLTDAMATKQSVYGLLCQICGKELANAASYKEHLRSHGALSVYRCLACKKSFSDSSNFAKHKKIHNLMVLICDICKKKFRSKDMLTRHIEEHMVTAPVECEICKKVFFTERDCKKHYRSRHVKSDSQFKCVICNVGFARLKFKWDHMWEEHHIRKFNADCPVCGCSFRKLVSVKRHMMQVHNKNLPHKYRTAIINSRRDIRISN